MPRRGENIYFRKDNRWEGRFIESRTITGKAVYRSVYGHTYSEVKNKLRFNCNQIAINPKRNHFTFAFYADEWLGNVKLKCRASTYNTYYNIYHSYLENSIGKYIIQQLTSEHFRGILENTEHLSPKTRNDVIKIAKRVFSYAESCGCRININFNALGVRVPIREMRVLSPAEQITLSDVLLNFKNTISIGIYLALNTGLRIGELCALKRENIDFNNGILHVEKTMQRIQTHETHEKTRVVISEPKSRKSFRDIPLPGALLSVIKPVFGSLPFEAYLLSGNSEHFIEPRCLQNHFKKFVNLSGIENINFHGLRHTFATRCIEAGMDIKSLSEILGHENIKITLDRYVHSSIELKRENMEKLSSYLQL